jgi:hypothetical protein
MMLHRLLVCALAVACPVASLLAEDNPAPAPAPLPTPEPAPAPPPPPVPSAVPPAPEERGLRIEDLRLEVGLRPAPDKVESVHQGGATSLLPTGSYIDDPAHDPGYGVTLSYVAGDLEEAGGLVWGGGLSFSTVEMHFAADFSGTRPNRDLTYATYGAFARIGYGYELSERIHVEAAPFVGGGIATSEWIDTDTGSTNHREKGSGSYWEYGIEATSRSAPASATSAAKPRSTSTSAPPAPTTS